MHGAATAGNPENISEAVFLLLWCGRLLLLRRMVMRRRSEELDLVVDSDDSPRDCSADVLLGYVARLVVEEPVRVAKPGYSAEKDDPIQNYFVRRTNYLPIAHTHRRATWYTYT